MLLFGAPSRFILRQIPYLIFPTPTLALTLSRSHSLPHTLSLPLNPSHSIPHTPSHPLPSIRSARSGVKINALRLWIGLRKKKALSLWTRWSRHKKQFSVVPRLNVHQMRRACRSAFLYMAYQSTSFRRQRLCVQAADRSYLVHTYRTSLRR